MHLIILGFSKRPDSVSSSIFITLVSLFQVDMRKPVFLIFLVPLFSFSQKIENTKAEATGEKIIITYDLIRGEPGDSYTVSLFASHNNFSAPLTRVIGDIGPNVKEGQRKRIEWESKAELGKYKGALSFEIEVIVFAPFSLKTYLTSSRRGKALPLTWRGGNQSQDVKIELLKGGIVQGTVGTSENKGTYQWNIPTKQKAGKDYSLRLSNGKETVDSEVFAIKPKVAMWIKVLPAVVLGAVLVVTKSSAEPESSRRLVGPPDILN